MSHFSVPALSMPDSLWAHSALPAPDTRALQGKHDSSVVVIGGGFTGLSAALHLAEAGKNVIVLEAAEIGYGGSGRNVGLVNAGLWTNPDDIDEVLGKTYGDRLDQALGQAPDLVFSLIQRFGIQCEATRNGTLHLAHSKSAVKCLEDRTRQLTRRGAPVQLLDAKTTAEKTGSQSYYGSILDPRAGTIQPLGYVRGLAAAALSLGAQIYTHSPITRLSRNSDDKGWTVRSESGEVTADKVILATNAYSNGLWPGLKQTFTPLHFFQFASEPLPSELLSDILPGKEGCWDTCQIMTSLRLDQSGRIVLGSVGQIPEQGSGFLKNWAGDYLKKFYPGLYSKVVASNKKEFWNFCWSGQIAYTPDHLPHLHVLAPDLITCIGYSGRGIGPGTVMGTAMAEHILGEPFSSFPLPVTELSKVFGRGIREQFYSHGSDLYHLYQRLI